MNLSYSNVSKYRIPLVRDTIGQDDLAALAQWLLGNPQLTKGPLCAAFEESFSSWQGCLRANYVNSGSSANLLAINALLASNRLSPGDRIIAPAVSWTTTVAPITQMNCVPVLCDCDLETLGVDIDHLEYLARQSGAKALIICHVLGIPCRMDEVISLCERYGLSLIEDCCEALGSEYRGIKVGNFSSLASFSFYYGHHMSTVEGGMLCTDSIELSNAVRSLRSHGWNRDLDNEAKQALREKYIIDPFADRYTFYCAGYNFRGNEIGAFLGLRQLKKLPEFIEARKRIWGSYCALMSEAQWQPRPVSDCVVSGFAFPMLSANRTALAARLENMGVETRPLICGSIGRQPWFIGKYGQVPLPNADIVHRDGLYVPINPHLSEHEVHYITECCMAAGEGSLREAL
ncbi:MAG: hypothetical protein A2169_06910 [Deltaproteobacteria bacterium RBG_13_47_9]|nr:MAG: hypothetical protein A2169_06910 [Deltaproteobacteria bacterium RBG_13_47_9]